jgi:glycerol-3-phosphate acyltransferase PlsX
MKIILDAMGGDKAPQAAVKGAVMAAKEYGYDITLAGQTSAIQSVLQDLSYPADKIKVFEAPEKIGMEEPAALSVRKKRNSSTVVCAGTLSLRLLPGVDRPGIAVIFPTLTKPCMVIDVGANIDPKPLHLLQYGIMGDAYSKHILGKKSPTVALLNIGEEATKGTDFIKETHMMLTESKLNFVGNVEPKEVYYGNADVVLCDGFVGNVFLKVTEGFADAASELLKRELKRSSILTKLGALLTLPAFNNIKRQVDATEYGGAPLLGVDGRIIIAHGSSNEKAMKNAIRVAGEYVSHKINVHIIEELESY